MSWVNKYWGETIRGMRIQAELPWMLLPSSSTPMFFNPSTQCLHSIWMPDKMKNGVFCGSSGPWLFINVVRPVPRHMIYNVCNGEAGGCIDLPMSVIDRQGVTHDAFFDMAAISGNPAIPGYIVVAVLNKGPSYHHTIAMWKYHQQVWVEIGTLPGGVYVSDMLFSQGTFHLLTYNEDVITLIPQNESLSMVTCNVKPRPSRGLDNLFENEEGNRLKKYLLESTGGKIVLVVRRIKTVTEKIRAFSLSVDDAGEATWVPYASPAGEMIYLGQAGSKAHATEMQDMIHFLDDRMEEAPAMEDAQYYKRDDMGGC